MTRNSPQNCQHEPAYPEHETVVFALSAPTMTAHRATGRCGMEAPHDIDQWGEFAAAEARRDG